MDETSFKERQRRSRLRCSCLKACVEASSLYANDETLDNFTFNCCEQMIGEAISTHDNDVTDLVMDDVWRFVLRQIKSRQ